MKILKLALLASIGFAAACGSDSAPSSRREAEAPATRAEAGSAGEAPAPDSSASATPAPAGRDAASLFEPDAPPAVNHAPSVQAVTLLPPDGIRAGEDATAVPRAEDPDGDPLSFHYRWTVNGRSAGADEPILASSHFARGDRIGLTVEADDGRESSHPHRIDPVEVANSPPRITSAPGPLDPQGTFRYELRAEDTDGDRGFHYALLDGPSGMTLDPIAGALLWTPTPDQAGTHPVTLSVDDRKGGVASQTFDLTIEFGTATLPAAPDPAGD